MLSANVYYIEQQTLKNSAVLIQAILTRKIDISIWQDVSKLKIFPL